MNDTMIKTRFGLILQGVTAHALKAVGVKFEEDVQYDTTCERPDFLIPDSRHPSYMIEVHQTDVRNSLAMKIFRAFIAVVEAKVHFGSNLTTVNLMFGDPDEDFSSSAVNALGAIYDVSVFPARTKTMRVRVRALEDASLSLAADERSTTKQAIATITSKHASTIRVLGKALQSAMGDAEPRAELDRLWKFERKRQESLRDVPAAGPPTYYKRNLLGALFLSDENFDDLLRCTKEHSLSPAVTQQLVQVGLAEVIEEIDDDHVRVDPAFSAFLRSSMSPYYRQLCSEVLRSEPSMYWYFEDIRDRERRDAMVAAYVRSLREGRKGFAVDFAENVLHDSYRGIEHKRAWYADLTAIYLDQGFNVLNKAIHRHPEYPLSLWSPFNNLALKWSAHERNHDYVNSVCTIIAELVFADRTRLAESDLQDRLVDGLLGLRVRSAIKLRRLNPLEIILKATCAKLGLKIKRSQMDSLLSDLASERRVGRLLMYRITATRGATVTVANVVAVHGGHGDDKSKEWAARRVASLYRLDGRKVVESGLSSGLFVLDGEWEDKDVARLHRAGWNHICRLGGLEDHLRSIFQI